jgi:hypothetical protein
VVSRGSSGWLCALPIFIFVGNLRAVDAPAGVDFTLRLPPGQTVRYAWKANTESESKGRELGKPFALKSESHCALAFALRGRQPNGEEGLPVAAKIEDYNVKDKVTVGEYSEENEQSKTRVKAIENGTTVVDSDNDIGLERVKAHRELIKQMFDGEARFALDPSGKVLGQFEGEPLVGELLKTCGLEGVLRVLPGRTIRAGESWEDSQSLPSIGVFKLSSPAVVRSKATFIGLEEKNGKRLARIEIATKWDPTPLKGENDDHLLVEITRVQGAGAGVYWFDPETGELVEGSIDSTSVYRLDGTKDGQSMGLDVSAKTGYAFKRN